MSYHVLKHGEIIPMDTRTTISARYKTITKAVNREFWNSTSETSHSLYVGSYGRGTAIDTSDIDMLVELPKSEYDRFDIYKGNGQSRLLQVVKSAIQTSYPRTDVHADGQVVVISFTDGIKFEVLPAFVSSDWCGNATYQYPDTNMGGNWRSTNPKAEQEAMRSKNNSDYGLLFDTCKHIRYIRDNFFSSYHLSGIVIDSFVYVAIGGWSWSQPTSTSSAPAGDYEKHLYNAYISTYRYVSTITAPGSNQTVDLRNSRDCLEKVLYKMTQ